MSRWPAVRLGQVLTHCKDFTEINDLEAYKRCRVQLHARGVVLRDQVAGAEIRTKRQQVCKAGEFLVAEIDAKLGGYGIVPPELDGAIVSSHYFLYAINETKLDRRFLGYFIRTPAFHSQVAAQGTTNYAAIRPAHVLEYEIPLPPMAQQRRLVEQLDELTAKIDEASRLRAMADEEAYAIIFGAITHAFDEMKHLPTHRIGQLGLDGSNPVQTGPFGAQLHASEFVEHGVPVLNVGNVWPEGLDLDRLDHVTQEKARLLGRYSIKADDILFARSGATLGKVCLVPTQCEGWLMSGHLFRLRLDQGRADPRFVVAGLRGARSIRNQVFGQVRGATRPGFNTTLLSQVEIPLPPMEKQQVIIEHIARIENRLKSLSTDQAAVRRELKAMLPAILDRAFNGEL